MKDKQIKDFRMKIGQFLHSYYVHFGEQDYEQFIKKLAPAIKKEYGSSFSEDNLRIMEAEYVTFNKKINKNNNEKK